MNEQLNQ